MTDSIIFYKSFYDAIKAIGNQNETEKVLGYENIFNYVFFDEEPSKKEGIGYAIFLMARPQIEANIKRRKNGESGGRPKKERKDKNNEKTKTKPNHNQTITKPEPNVNVNVVNNDLTQEDKSSFVKLAEPPVSEEPIFKDEKKYFFEGKVIKLNERDFKSWEKAYPDLNLRAELIVRDTWLAEHEERKKNWFPTTAQYFIKQNEIRKQQHQDLEKGGVF